MRAIVESKSTSRHGIEAWPVVWLSILACLSSSHLSQSGQSAGQRGKGVKAASAGQARVGATRQPEVNLDADYSRSP